MKAFQIALGLFTAGSSIVAWHFWHVDGLLAALVALGGIALAFSAFPRNTNEEDGLD